MNQTELAKRTGVSQPYLSRMAKGLRRPSLEVAKKLAEAVPETNALDWMENPAAMLAKALGQEDSCLQPEQSLETAA